MYEAFVRIHPKHQNLENVEHKFRKQESNNLTYLKCKHKVNLD